MSDYIYRFIPMKVGVSPKHIDEDKINLLLPKNIKYDIVRVVRAKEIRFIDCGENLESIKCNECGNDIKEDWSDYMGQSHITEFEDRLVILKCCNNETLLENLDYYFDVGFSRFVIEIVNPNNLDYNEFLLKLNEAFGLQFKFILAKI